MKYLDIYNRIAKNIVFTHDDLLYLNKSFSKTNLLNWQKKGYIAKLRRGLYVFVDMLQTDRMNKLYYISNRMYEPSYVSGLSVLSMYNLIPESVNVISSITTKKTLKLKNDFGYFFYHSIKKSLFWGYKLKDYTNYYVKVACLEKALLDYLYLNPHLEEFDDFYELRIDTDELLSLLDMKKFKLFAKKFNKKVFSSRVEHFILFLKSDDRHYKY